MSNMIFFFSGMPRRQSRLVDSISLTLSLRHNPSDCQALPDRPMSKWGRMAAGSARRPAGTRDSGRNTSVKSLVEITKYISHG